MLHYLNQQLAPAAKAVGERVLIENVSRRAFLKGTASGVGLVVAMQLVPFRSAGAFEQYPTGGLDMPNGIVTDPHVFVSIDPDGTVTIVAHRSEMGTGARTSLPMVLADEMEADWARVKIVQAPGDEPKYGNQDTDGSRSMRHHIQPMRQIGAAVRAMLEQAAAKEWGVDVELSRAQNHEVVLLEKVGEGMAETDQGSATASSPRPRWPCRSRRSRTSAFKDESEFRYIGKGEVPIYDLHDITTGKAIYGADVSLPGMKYAVVARPPVVGGKVKSVDSTAALAVPGVEQVVQIEGSMPPAKFAPLGGVAVVADQHLGGAPGPRRAQDRVGRRPARLYNTEQYHQEMSATAAKPGKVIRNQGDVGRRLRGRGQGGQRRVLPAAHGAHRHGAAGGAGQRRRRQGGDLGAGAEPLGHAPGRGREARRADRERDGPRHAARRRLRAQVEVRLRARGGDPLAGGGRAGAGAVDPRGRHPAQLLPHHLGRADRGGAGCRQQGHRLAASQRRAVDPLDLRRGQRLPVLHRVRHGLRRHAVRHRQHPLRERPGDGAHPDRVVPLGLEHPARVRGAVVRGGARATSSAGTRRTSCSS